MLKVGEVELLRMLCFFISLPTGNAGCSYFMEHDLDYTVMETSVGGNKT